MKLAFAIPNLLDLKVMRPQPWERAVTGADQTRMVKWADDHGYDMLCACEHFVIPNSHLELSGAKYPHAAALQGYLAGATQRIRINSGVAILPLQHPIVTAKALSTIDAMSSGRITTTFGVGWLKEEFESLGVPFHERGAMADEYLAAIIELWTKESPTFEGKYVSFRDIAFEPKPVQKPHLPIWIGGDAEAALKRVARFASGWWPFLTQPQDIAARVDFIKSQPTWKGGELEVCYLLSTSDLGEGHVVKSEKKDLSRQEIVDGLGQLKEQGVTMSAVPIPSTSSIQGYLDHAQMVIEEIKPKLR